jgi:tripartite-type tricarboxylate transporter receptor subunit TctC
VKLPRRRFLHLAAGAAALPALSRFAQAQAYPSRPVRIMVPFAAGGGQDILARLIGQWLSERLGQTFIIENRPGAGTNIATEAAIRSPADGHTLLLVTPANATNAALYERLSFNFLRDIAPVAGLMRAPNVIVVHPSFPAKTIPEFIAYANANPDKVNYASPGNGTSQHIGAELFKLLANIKMVHVPYRGAVPALSDLLGGQIQVSFLTLASATEYIATGKVRPLAVTTLARAETIPDVATVDSFLPGYEASSWTGLGAPRNTPAELIDKLNKEINTGLANPRMKARITDLGGTVLSGSAADFGKLIADETEKWGKVIRTANIKPE